MNKNSWGFYLSLGALAAGGLLWSLVEGKVQGGLWLYLLLCLVFLICTYPAFLLSLFGLFKYKEDKKILGWTGLIVSGILVGMVFYFIFMADKMPMPVSNGE